MRNCLLVVLAVGISVFAWAHDANARCDRPWTTGPVVDAKAGITLESLDARLECSGSRGKSACRLRETYVVRGGPVGGTAAAIYFHPTVRPEIHIDGLRAIASDPPQLEGDDERIVELTLGESGDVMGFVIPTSPGMSRRIVIETRVRHDPACHEPIPIERRHPLVSRFVATDIGIDARGTLGLEKSSDYTESRTLRLPSHWELDRKGGWRRDRDRHRGEWRPKAWSSFAIERRPAITWGGPFAAVGVARRSGSAETKLRAGWEAGVMRRVLVNVAVESDAKRHLEIVPGFEVGFSRSMPRDLWFVPLPTVGMGAPVQIEPTTRGGVRGLVGLYWPYVALVGFLDGYPPVGSQRRIVTGGAMLQFGI